jgi:hypothetical protein
VADPKHFMVRLDPDFHLALRRYSLETGKPLSTIVLQWIREGWERVPNHEAYEKSKAEPEPEEPKAPSKPKAKK